MFHLQTNFVPFKYVQIINCFNFWHKLQLLASQYFISLTQSIIITEYFLVSKHASHRVESFKCIESINTPASFTTNVPSFVNFDSLFVCLTNCSTEEYFKGWGCRFIYDITVYQLSYIPMVRTPKIDSNKLLVRICVVNVACTSIERTAAFFQFVKSRSLVHLIHENLHVCLHIVFETRRKRPIYLVE